MKSENPVTFRLKITTVAIIDEWINDGKYLSLKDACFQFYHKCKKKKANCGFILNSPDKFYSNLRQFRNKFTKIHTEKNSKSFIPEELQDYDYSTNIF